MARRHGHGHPVPKQSSEGCQQTFSASGIRTLRAGKGAQTFDQLDQLRASEHGANESTVSIASGDLHPPLRRPYLPCYYARSKGMV